jgi:hypothetical protein
MTRRMGRNAFEATVEPDHVWLRYETRGARSWHNVVILPSHHTAPAGFEQRFAAVAAMAADLFLELRRSRRGSPPRTATQTHEAAS